MPGSSVAEQLSDKEQVAGSIPASATIFNFSQHVTQGGKMFYLAMVVLAAWVFTRIEIGLANRS
jgi:flagellar biogenesis protein FliO